MKNYLVPGVEGWFTIHHPSGRQMTIYDAAMKYKEENIPLVIIAGKEYGTGSSRDWAAKGVMLLGVKAIIAESFERIHRSNLAGMGVLPLQFLPGQNVGTLGLTGKEAFSIRNLEQKLAPGVRLEVVAHRQDSSQMVFEAILRLDTEVEIDYFRKGGILQAILYKIMKAKKTK